MGLLLYSILLFFGARGMPLKRATPYCLASAALLTVLAIGAVDDLPMCSDFLCNDLSSLALALLINLALSFGSFGLGSVGKRLFGQSKGA